MRVRVEDDGIIQVIPDEGERVELHAMDAGIPGFYVETVKRYVNTLPQGIEEDPDNDDNEDESEADDDEESYDDKGKDAGKAVSITVNAFRAMIANRFNSHDHYSYLHVDHGDDTGDGTVVTGGGLRLLFHYRDQNAIASDEDVFLVDDPATQQSKEVFLTRTRKSGEYRSFRYDGIIGNVGVVEV